MQTNALAAIVLDVVAFGFLVYAMYYASQQRKKPAAPSEPKPRSVVVEPPRPEPAPTPEPKAVAEAPKAEPAKMTEADPPMAVVETKVETHAPEKEAKPKSPKHATDRKEQGFSIIDIEGIGKRYTEKLHAINIYHTAELLKAGATPSGRAELAAKTGISQDLILEWVNLSDLFRIKGIGEEYSDLLEQAGVDTVVELSHRNAANLHAKIVEVNDAKRLVRRPPSLAHIEDWINEAKKLPRAVEY